MKKSLEYIPNSNIYTTNKEILRTVEKEKPLIFDCIVYPIYKDSNLSQKRYKDYLFLEIYKI